MVGLRENLPPGLHMIPGASAASSFSQAYGNDVDVLVHQDMLSFGPTPRCSLKEWIGIRHEFLGGGEFRTTNDLSVHAARLADDSPIHIWAGAGIEDQLFVAFAIELARQVGRELNDVWLVQYERPPGSNGLVVGLGELNPSQLAAFPDPVPLKGHLASEYEELWRAITADTPDEFYLFPERHPGVNSNVQQAALLMRRRLPNRSSGLSYWNYQMLRQTLERGPRAVRVIGFTMGHEDFRSRDAVGDIYLYDQMHALADPGLNQPLLTLSNFGAPMRENEVRLTEFGHSVLNGTASYFPLNPIDYWVGGVHLSSAEGRIWFDDEGELVAG